MQSNNQIAETPKLKVVVTVTHTENVEKEIPLPYYFKNSNDRLCKLISKDYFIQVNTANGYWSTEIYPAKNWQERIATGTPIEADEFEVAFSQAKMYIETIYRNEEPSKEVDDNEQIDQMLYGEAI